MNDRTQEGERGERQARELYGKTERRLANPDLPPEAKQALANARSMATVAWQAFKTGWIGQGRSAMATAWRYLGEVDRLTLLPHAKHGRDIALALTNARDQRNADVKFEAQLRYADRQRIVKEVSRDYPEQSKAQVARHVKKRAPDIEQNAETIAKKIIPPNGSHCTQSNAHRSVASCCLAQQQTRTPTMKAERSAPAEPPEWARRLVTVDEWADITHEHRVTVYQKRLPGWWLWQQICRAQDMEAV